VLLHTAAIASVNYWSQNNIDNLEVTAIERVEVDPEPSPAPSTKASVPLAKPTPTPELKIQPKAVKPPTVTSVPRPIPVEKPTPKAISTPAPVVKITKSAPIKPSTSGLDSLVSPAPNRITKPAKIAKTAPIVSQPSNLPPAFPEKLFATPAPKPQRTKIASNPPQTAVLKNPQNPQLATKINRSVLPLTDKPAKLTPNLSPDSSTTTTPDNDELIPTPGNPSKLARATDRSPVGNNQTNFTDRPKLPPGLGDNLGSLPNDAPTSSDDFGGTPGNNTRMANNNPTATPSNNNQTGLANNSTNRSGINTNFANSGGDDRTNSNDDAMGGMPGNNTRIARSNSGKDPRISSPGSGLNNNNGNGNGSGGTPGNIATGSKTQATIQCLRNCEIRYSDELADSEVGKDKILVKVTIDANGMVSAAEIARSSGNQKLDLATIAGIKQMQLNATGKIRTHRVKINTLTGN
jgi:TonB family protein